MKTAILATAVLAGAVHAEVIECPAKHEGARLLGAAVYAGEDKRYELVGARKSVRNGMDAEYGFHRGDAKWVACWYEPETPKWYKVDYAVTSCVLKEREAPSGRVISVVRCK